MLVQEVLASKLTEFQEDVALVEVFLCQARPEQLLLFISV